jgi:hypothetical protein
VTRAIERVVGIMVSVFVSNESLSRDGLCNNEETTRHSERYSLASYNARCDASLRDRGVRKSNDARKRPLEELLLFSDDAELSLRRQAARRVAGVVWAEPDVALIHRSAPKPLNVPGSC